MDTNFLGDRPSEVELLKTSLLNTQIRLLRVEEQFEALRKQLSRVSSEVQLLQYKPYIDAVGGG